MNPTLTGETGGFKFQGSLVPTSNELYSLGSTTSRWKDLNISGTVNATSFVGDGSLLTGITSGGTSLWSQSSSNVYVTGSNVGINTATPTNALHVVGNTRIEGNLTVNGTQTIVNTNVGTTEQLIITNDGTGPALVVNQTGSQPVLDVQDDGVSVLKILDGGNVGIGTTNPQAKLHINDTGAMIIPSGTTAQLPSAPVPGMVRFNIDTKKLQYYNSFEWTSIGGISAQGGNSTVDLGGYRIHIYTSSGSFTVNTGGAVEYLVVAGGGGGGCRFGGGGGAGGLLYSGSYNIANGTYAITIGAGGAGGPTNNTRGSSGNNSSIGSIIVATGGGGGAAENVTALAGGSGGGGSYSSITAGTGTSGQGFNGGTGQASIRVNGGGGGSAELGKGSGTRPDGGNGLQYSVSGSPVYYAGGGGGADNRIDSAGFGGPTAGNGGLGGGGQGGGGESSGQADARSGTGVSGTTNTGGGGGGGSYIPAIAGGRPGGAGGSGIVIIRYLL